MGGKANRAMSIFICHKILHFLLYFQKTNKQCKSIRRNGNKNKKQEKNKTEYI